MAVKYRMPKEEREVEAELRELRKAVIRRECLMRKTLAKYEELVAEKVRLEATIMALRTFQEARQRNSLNAFKQ